MALSSSLRRSLNKKVNYVAYIDNDGEEIKYSSSGVDSRKKPETLKKEIMQKTGLAEDRIFVDKGSVSSSDYMWKKVNEFLDKQKTTRGVGSTSTSNT